MKTAVIQFPGSNCERDAFTVLAAQGMNPFYVWHEEKALPDETSLVLLPGGFTYGDYLRCGAMAALAPIMQDVKRFASHGGKVVGICNGFQILCEARLLEGTLTRNQSLKFACKNVYLRVENHESAFTRHYARQQVINIPIAHHDGRYMADAATLKSLEKNNQILFRYCTEQGELSDAANPNGSLHHIAGICNAEGNVMGMMPHPERHAERLLGGTDGAALFTALKAA